MKVMSKVLLLFFLSLTALSGISFAGEFQLYPGAQPRDDLGGTASGPLERSLVDEFREENLKTLVYVTTDPFEAVVDFYAKAGRQYRVGALERRRGKNLYTEGKKLEEAFFILDGAPDLWTSRLWVKVQNPLIERVQGEALNREYQNIRELTAIVLVDRRESFR